jgi:hypothetical protein
VASGKPSNFVNTDIADLKFRFHPASLTSHRQGIDHSRSLIMQLMD